MDKILYFADTRNCKQETMYYIQENKAIFEKLVTLKFLRKKDKLVTRKRQIRLSSNVSRVNNKLLEQLEKFYPGKN